MDIDSALQALLASLETQYEQLKAAYDAETDVQKLSDLDDQLASIGKDLISLKTQVMTAQVMAKRTSLDAPRLNSFAAELSRHASETSSAIKQYSDSVAHARYLASRLASGSALIASFLKVA